MSTLILRRQWFITSRVHDIKSEYTFVEELGKGTFGKVFKAIHKESGLERAIKVIIKPNITEYATFITELGILKNLDHPNIVNIIETFETENLCFLVLELCRGGDLLDRIVSEKSFSEQKAAHIMKTLFSAIWYCHRNNICHLDLKPENCVYFNKDPNSEIKLIDFGLSTVASEEDILHDVRGTPYYIAPEVLSKNYNNKADCWSLGVIMYMLLTGAFPFNGRNNQEILMSVYNGSFSFRHPNFKYVSESAKDLIAKLLVKDVSHRLSAEQAFNHEWIQGLSPSIAPALPLEYINNIIKFVNSRNMKKAAMMYIATKLTEQELCELKEIFKEIDANGDGFINSDELQRAIISSHTIPQQRLDFIVSGIDFNKNGMIDYIEFITACLKKQHYSNLGLIRSAFRHFDRDNSGFITPDELKQAMCCNEMNPEIDARVEKMILEADTNDDGKIDYAEFLALLSVQSLHSFT